MSAKVKGLALLLCILGIGLAAERRADDAPRIPQPAGFPPRVYEGTRGANDSALNMLGRTLFNDPTLSLDSSTSCETCHQSFAAFAHIDHAVSHGVQGRIGRRNVPSLQNLAWQKSFMWDGAITNLDMQSLSPLTGHEEMSNNLDTILARVASNAEYLSMMRAAYGSDSVSIPRILRALGRFVAGLVSADSRYDRYMAGTDTLADNEQRGLALFRRHCASCHTEPLFTNGDFASNGITPSTITPDSGRYEVSRVRDDLFRFKVPTLRNITRTHPYMHDGRFKRLRDVLAHYATPSAHAPHTDPRIRAIGPLNDAARKNIIAFLMTLESGDR